MAKYTVTSKLVHKGTIDTSKLRPEFLSALVQFLDGDKDALDMWSLGDILAADEEYTPTGEVEVKRVGA